MNKKQYSNREIIMKNLNKNTPKILNSKKKQPQNKKKNTQFNPKVEEKHSKKKQISVKTFNYKNLVMNVLKIFWISSLDNRINVTR